MPGIDDFLEKAASDNELDLARVNIAGGDERPFFCAQMRSFSREGDDTDEVVAETFGIRSLLVDAKARTIKVRGDKTVTHNAPTLLRVYPRPRKFGGAGGVESNRLFLWEPQGKSTGDSVVRGTFTQSDAASDLLVAPATPWRDTDAEDIRVPHLRLVDGRAAVDIALGGTMAKFLSFDGKDTLFGGLTVAAPGAKLKAVLVPEGIEFAGALRDPTRDFTGGNEKSRIEGIFRLECDTRGNEPHYLLRLISSNEAAITATEDRIAEALSGLLSANAPVAVRYDKRPVVPPIFWPLTQEKKPAGAESGLRLHASGDDFEMRIAASAVDVRIQTHGLYESESGLASLFTGSVSWRRIAAKQITLTILAGEATAGGQNTKITFDKEKERWTATVGDIVDRPYSIPLGPVAERLLTIYRAGGGISPTAERAQFLFIPVDDGWLQLAVTGPAQAGPSNVASAMGGTIFVSHKDGDRGLAIDGASHVQLNIGWTGTGAEGPTVANVTLDAGGARGRLFGFLHVAETSPSPREVLPTLRGGPAATRDLPLWFGTGAPAPSLAGVFTWRSATGSFAAAIDVFPDIEVDGVKQPSALAWLPAGDSPLITSIPLTRTLPSAPEPSLSRGLVPRAIGSGKGSVMLAYDGEVSLPRLWMTSSTWYSNPDGVVGHSLVLPTLAGTEFAASDGKPPSSGVDRARLRLDLPILDELFAWSDPPKKRVTRATGTEDVNLPTALEPERLRETWQVSLSRVALTRSQAAELSGWVTPGTKSAQNVKALVAPYTWSTDLTIDPILPDAWGSYELATVTYRLDSAAEGIGGAQPVGFKISGNVIAVDEKADFTIAGNAANLFAHALSETQPVLMWDSRGFGQSAISTEGSRTVRALLDASGSNITMLRTLSSVVEMDVRASEPTAWTFLGKLCFFARDLPTSETGFDGTKNPIESAAGMRGQAFDDHAFASSLHEWRLFQSFPNFSELIGNPPLPKVPKPHDLRWGPFLFKPLRLLKVTFDARGAPELISVAGSLRFAPVSPLWDDVPFDEDDVYLRENLFELTLTRDGETWGQSWAGLAAVVAGDTVTFKKPTTPTVSFTAELGNGNDKDIGPGAVISSGKVAARIEIDIVSLAATVSARLFGSDCQLSGKAAPRGGGLTIGLDVNANPAPGPTRAMFHPVSATVEIDGETDILKISGRIVVSAFPPDKEPKAAAGDIVSIDEKGLTWLGVHKPKSEPVVVDHATGAFTWKGNFPTGGGTAVLPFRFEAVDLAFKAALAFVAPAGGLGGPSLVSIDMGSAWAHATLFDTKQPDHRMTYRFLASIDGVRRHRLDISWSRSIESPIAWPLGQVKMDRNKPLPDDWLKPEKADHSKRDRTIFIDEDAAQRLRHSATLNLRDHRIDVDDLTVVNGMLTARRPVRLLVVTDHVLRGADSPGSDGQPAKPGAPRAKWTTLDHVVITSRALMAEECATVTFSPVEKARLYRGDPTGMAHNGIAPFTMAGAGFHDSLLRKHWWTDGDHGLVVIGGAAVQFPVPEADDTVLTTVFPWIDITTSDGKPVDHLNMKAGTWRIPSADLWPATPMKSGVLPMALIGSRMPEQAIRRQFGVAPSADKADDGAPEKIIPVEQTFFEDSDNGDIDLAAAPLFLRAMMAVSARMAKDPSDTKDVVAWNAAVIEAGRFVSVGANDLRQPFPVLRVKVKAEPAAAVATGAEMASASLVALSQRRASWLDGYRRIAAEAMDDQSDRTTRNEIADLATDLDPSVLLGIRVAAVPGGAPSFCLRPIVPAFGPVAEGRPLTRVENDIGPSAALGWPSAAGLRDLHRHVPVLGDELPVLGHRSGFSARFQMFGWPAYAPERQVVESSPEARSAEALYLSFGHHIVYDRGSAAKLPFDGPTARHLLPAVARRRSPLPDRTDDVLKTLLRPASAGASTKAAGLPAAPILPPSVERGTVGRRPGVMEAVVASMTIPGDRAPFDPDHGRFGRPANSTPVVAHQLRNPRSPILPPDEMTALAEDGSAESEDHRFAEMERITLDLRRRTYLSMADCDIATGKVPLFGRFEGSADIARFATGIPARHDRLVFSLAPDLTVGPVWNGQLVVGIEGKTAPKARAAPMLRLTGWLEIGAQVFPAIVGAEADGSRKLDLDALPKTMTLSIRQVPNATAALRLANADTVIRVVLEMLEFSDPASAGALPASPRWQAILPLMLDPGARRVVAVTRRTIVFADPSYDRQLASQAASDRVMVPFVKHKVLLLAADRKEYVLASTLRFAGGFTDDATGEFAPLKLLFAALDEAQRQALERFERYTLAIRRLPPRLPNGDQPQPELLCLDFEPADSYLADCGKAYEIPLKRLVRHGNETDPCPLQPGDRLELTATMTAAEPDMERRSVTVVVDIVAEPVIAPPPSVYTVIASSIDRKLSRSVLHASGPLPQKIEFPDLVRDLALGHVRRRAVFVWAYATPGAGLERLDLVKFDRSGGAQLPVI